MRPRIRQSRILGPDGRPAASFLYPTPRYNLRQYKPRYWLGADTRSNVSEYDRWELVNYSRQLFAQIGNLSTAVKEKNSWSFGDAWDPHYLGRNPKWGEEALDFLKNQFFPMCNIRGPQYDFKRSLRLSGQAWDVDGDDAMVLTQTERGFPQLAFFPATKIGLTATAGRGKYGNGDKDNTVNGGAFDGAKIFDGVIYDRNLRPIALRIVDANGDFQDIPSFSADLAYEPDWQDQGRGIPRVATCLLRWMSQQDIDDFLHRGMKRAAAIGLKFKKEEGEAGLGNEVLTGEEVTEEDGSSSDRKVYYEEIEGGEMYYLNSSTGEDIESLNYQNPHPNSEAFVERIIREGLASLGWRYELMDLSSTGRAPSRLTCDIANQNIWERQATGERRWRRAIVYALAKAMKNGFLSPNNDGMDPYLWEPGLPKVLSVDAGNDEAADRENLKLGTTSKAILAQKKGLHYRDIAAQRENEVRDLIATAKGIEKDTGVAFDNVMQLLEQRTPNGAPQQKTSNPDASPQTTKKK